MIRKRPQKRSSSGFTLVEVLIALAVLAIGILGIVGIQYRIVSGNASSNFVTQELMLAQLMLETMKNNQTPSNLVSETETGLDQFGNQGGPYSVEKVIVNPIGGPNSRFIQVTVTKDGPGGHPITVRALTHGNGI